MQSIVYLNRSVKTTTRNYKAEKRFLDLKKINLIFLPVSLANVFFLRQNSVLMVSCAAVNIERYSRIFFLSLSINLLRALF